MRMKPSKTAYTTKKKPAKRADGGNPIIDKLLKLKYRINDMYRNGGPGVDENETKTDKRYVMSLISDIRKHGFTKLAPEDGHCCNGLWRKYAG